MRPSLALALALLALAGCSDEPRRVELCGNHLDDDGDLLVDCEDPECLGQPACDVQVDADLDAGPDAEADLEVDDDSGRDADPEGEADLEPSCDADVDREGSSRRCEPAVGAAAYSVVYDARVNCSAEQQPFWFSVYWEAEVAEGARIDVVVRSSARFDDLPCAPEVALFSAPGDVSPADLSLALIVAGVDNGLRYLELIARLSCPAGTGPAELLETDLVAYCDCACDTDSSCQTTCTCDADC